MAPVLKLMGFKTTLKSSYKDSFATFELKNKRTAFKDINIYDYDSGSGEKHLFINAHGALPGIANNSTLFGDNKFIGADMLINEIKNRAPYWRTTKARISLRAFLRTQARRPRESSP